MNILYFLLATSAHAHKPFFSDGEWSGPEAAFEVEDPEVSIVVYQPVSCDSPELWMGWEARAGDEIWISLGLPEIDRLVDYRPALAVVAPGLGEAPDDLPFELPDGLGIEIFDTTDVAEADSFYEPFTRTDSWMLVETWFTLPEDGPAYLVAWDPAGWTGKLWVALGTIEDFSDVSPSDYAEWSPLVQGFHETGEYEEPPEIEEAFCVQDASPVSEDEVEPTGCVSAAVPAAGLWALLGLAVGWTRRRALEPVSSNPCSPPPLLDRSSQR